jgi:hypothetical protein
MPQLFSSKPENLDEAVSSNEIEAPMRSLKLNTPKVSTQPRVSARPTVSAPPRSGGIVPPGKAVPSRVSDGFERPTQGPGRKGGSVFEPGRPTAQKPTGGIKGSDSVRGQVTFSPGVLDSLKKVGEDVASKLGGTAKKSDVKQSIADALKNIDLGSSSKKVFKQAYRVAYQAYRAACYSSASGLRPQPTE